MLKLNAGFSRKVGEPNYGSRGASVNVELEVESQLISDPEGLSRRIRGLFELARQAVDDELAASSIPTGDDPNRRASHRFDNNGRHTPPHAHDDRPHAYGRQGNDRANQPSNPSSNPRYATKSQIRAIQAICDRQGSNALQRAHERFGVHALNELTLRAASQLIDELKAAPAHPGGKQ